MELLIFFGIKLLELHAKFVLLNIVLYYGNISMNNNKHTKM